MPPATSTAANTNRLLAAAWLRKFRARLLRWFATAARDLPWRKTRDPYAVWISEIMLQQTQVATVIPYFERFLAEFPTVVELAQAEESRVLRLWEGLGYYRRARQLHAAAKKIVAEHAGQFPITLEQVRALPGIGRYTAGAILSIALDQRLPILEANTVRLFARLLAYAGDPLKQEGQKILWQVAEELLPANNAGRFNQALMELGSLVCTPKSPRCSSCPVSELCPTFAQGLQEQIPAPAKKMKFEEVREAAVIVRQQSKVLLRECQPGERWAGLWDFPRVAVEAETPAAAQRELIEKLRGQTGLELTLGERLTTLKHGVTRFRITLDCYAAALAVRRGKLPAGKPLAWVEIGELERYPLSTTGRKLAKLVGLASRGSSS